MLEESLTAQYSEPFYAGYFADLRRGAHGCAPLAWEGGRVRPADAHEDPAQPSA